MRAALLALLAGCGVSIDPAASGLADEVHEAVEYWRARGHDVSVGDGIPVVWEPDVVWHDGRRVPAAFDEERIHLNERWVWWFGGECNGGVSIVRVLKHEIGHGLGLEHSDDPKDIMFPSVGICEE